MRGRDVADACAAGDRSGVSNATAEGRRTSAEVVRALDELERGGEVVQRRRSADWTGKVA